MDKILYLNVRDLAERTNSADHEYKEFVNQYAKKHGYRVEEYFSSEELNLSEFSDDTTDELLGLPQKFLMAD